MIRMYKIVLILFLIPLAISATNKTGKYTKNKKISKEFTVDKNATLNVSNKYGNIDIVTWDSNKIEMEITITTTGDDEEKVKNRLEQINVKFESSSSAVTAKTIIEKSSKSWNIWGRKNNVSMDIHYQIKMPVSNNVNLANDYGGINLDKLEGTSTIDCDYGQLIIGELLNSSNKINIDYTNKSTIDFMKSGSINADYSGLTIEKSGTVDLNADYSKLTFGTVASLKFNCDYGDLKIESVGTMTGHSDYMHTVVGVLTGSGDFNFSYGTLKVNAIAANFNHIAVKSNYTSLKFGVGSDNSFNILADLNHIHLKKVDGFTFQKEIKKSGSAHYEGYFNSANSNKKITLNSNYGSISFTNK